MDAVVGAICEKIQQGTFEVGIAEDTEVAEPDDAEFRAWSDMIAESLREVYADPRHPANWRKSQPGWGWHAQVDTQLELTSRPLTA